MNNSPLRDESQLTDERIKELYALASKDGQAPAWVTFPTFARLVEAEVRSLRSQDAVHVVGWVNPAPNASVPMVPTSPTVTVQIGGAPDVGTGELHWDSAKRAGALFQKDGTIIFDNRTWCRYVDIRLQIGSARQSPVEADTPKNQEQRPFTAVGTFSGGFIPTSSKSPDPDLAVAASPSDTSQGEDRRLAKQWTDKFAQCPYCFGNGTDEEGAGCEPCERTGVVERTALKVSDTSQGVREAKAEYRALQDDSASFDAWCPYKGSPDAWTVWKAARASLRAALRSERT